MKAIEVIRTEGTKGFLDRWKKGIQEVTPLQQTNSQILFTDITIVGLFLGVIISVWKWKTLWWVGIVLIGALGNTIIQLLALKQKQKLLKELEGGQDETKEGTI